MFDSKVCVYLCAQSGEPGEAEQSTKIPLQVDLPEKAHLA